MLRDEGDCADPEEGAREDASVAPSPQVSKTSSTHTDKGLGG